MNAVPHNQIRLCTQCGFILDTRPGLRAIDGVCSPCINHKKKQIIDFSSRQQWLTEYIARNKTNASYDCLIAVSGGKDSHMIVSNLIENHGVHNPLLVTVDDEFTPTHAGEHNRKNIGSHFGCDHITFRLNPQELNKATLRDFEEALHPLKWLEEQLYTIPVTIAQKFGISLCFFGENSEFEYGSAETLKIFHPTSTDSVSVIFLGAIYPYTTDYSLQRARMSGFKDLDDYNEWPRTGSIDSFTQIDSIGYIVHLWCKFPKFGFQRVSDMACRFVREGKITREQAERYIKDTDYILDISAKRDFCRTLQITEKYFDTIVEKHANTQIVRKDCNGQYRRVDFF